MGGRNTPAERLRRRLREGFLEARLLVDGSICGWLVVPISTTVGSRVWSPTVAASGRAASMATLVSWALSAQQQRIHNPKPLSQSSPSLSCRTSHIWPSRPPSREGFAVGLQVMGWERLETELFTRKGLAVKSCLRSRTAGLYMPGNLQSSRPKGNAKFHWLLIWEAV